MTTTERDEDKTFYQPDASQRTWDALVSSDLPHTGRPEAMYYAVSTAEQATRTFGRWTWLLVHIELGRVVRITRRPSGAIVFLASPGPGDDTTHKCWPRYLAPPDAHKFDTFRARSER